MPRPRPSLCLARRRQAGPCARPFGHRPRRRHRARYRRLDRRLHRRAAAARRRHGLRRRCRAWPARLAAAPGYARRRARALQRAPPDTGGGSGTARPRRRRRELPRHRPGSAGRARPRRAECRPYSPDQAAIRGRQGPCRQGRGGAGSGVARGSLLAHRGLARRASRLVRAWPYRKSASRPRRQCRVPDRGAAQGMSELVELTVETIGARGDGVARDGGGSVYVPFTVPGDRVRARIEEARGEGRAATVLEMIALGPGRAVPPCRHFGVCVGCALQHLDAALYADSKTAILRAALAHHGLADAPLRPLKLLPPGTRRRVRLALARPARKAAAPIVGFSERASHDLVDLGACAVLSPKLFALVAPLRALSGELLRPGEAGHATLQLADSGIDALLDLPRAPDLAALESLAAFAEAQDLARLLWRASRREPTPGAPPAPVPRVAGGAAHRL